MFEQMIYNCLPYIVDTLNIQLEMSTYIGEKKNFVRFLSEYDKDSDCTYIHVITLPVSKPKKVCCNKLGIFLRC